MATADFAQIVKIPQDVCTYTREVLRKYSDNFKISGKKDEPPLRMLEHGLHGEHVVVPLGESPPFPYMLQRDDKFYHGYRFDMDVSDEVTHATPSLQKIFGKTDQDADQSFRNVLGYAVGQSSFQSLDGGQLSRLLSDALLPAALKVFGEENNPEALKHSRIYSLYANLLLPGHIVKLHLDVPELRGVDRSKCPSWLLVAAHCSGLFSNHIVRNVTSVFYPKTAPGGALCAYSPGLEVGHVFPVEEGLTAVLDTDSCFHHSAQARRSSSKPGEAVEIPKLPGNCFVEVEEKDGQVVWRVVENDTRQLVCCVPEEDIRFSVSCKFHIFRSEEEAKQYEDPTAGLTPEQMIRTMKEDLLMRGKIPEGWVGEDVPLYQLGPVFYKEYIQSRAPTTQDVENAWAKFL